MSGPAIVDEALQGGQALDRPSGRWSWLAFASVAAAAWLVVWRLHAEHGGHGAAEVGLGATIVTWSAMTAAMMLPTMVPMLRALREVLGADRSGGSVEARWWVFVGGYLTVWSGASLVGSGLQVAAGAVGLVDGSGRARSVMLACGVLILAGAYQLSSFKRRCQEQCVMPMTFFWRWWRDGLGGAWQMGLRHGLMCLGCCWALMLLAFVGGMADLVLMALFTLLMVIDKLPGASRRLTASLGVALIAAGTLVAVLALTSAAPGDHLHGAGPLGPAPSSTSTLGGDR